MPRSAFPHQTTLGSVDTFEEGQGEDLALQAKSFGICTAPIRSHNQMKPHDGSAHILAAIQDFCILHLWLCALLSKPEGNLQHRREDGTDDDNQRIDDASRRVPRWWMRLCRGIDQTWQSALRPETCGQWDRLGRGKGEWNRV